MNHADWYNSKTSVTGRDAYIMAKALYWALKFSQNQPDVLREWNDEADMKAILKAKFPHFATGLRMSDENTLKLLKEDEAAGQQGAHHDKEVAYVTPPDLSDDPTFLEAGDAPTPPPGFVDEDEAAPLAPDSDKNRRDLKATIRGTLDAFREPK